MRVGIFGLAGHFGLRTDHDLNVGEILVAGYFLCVTDGRTDRGTCRNLTLVTYKSGDLGCLRATARHSS